MGGTMLKTGAAVAACAALGSFATRDVNSPWYRRLRKPRIQPPVLAFPVAWTALYADLAVTSAVALDTLGEDERPAYLGAFATNLLLNASWCWVAFRAHRLGWAIPAAALLAISSGDLVRRTADADTRAGLALAPYAMWCGFATVLSAELWRVNRP